MSVSFIKVIYEGDMSKQFPERSEIENYYSEKHIAIKKKSMAGKFKNPSRVTPFNRKRV
jgi:hypothetical protein